MMNCGLNREKHKKIGELSKGYRQRGASSGNDTRSRDFNFR